MKNDVQNENFRLRMQKTMLNFVFDIQIQNTKYKVQNTKYKDNDDTRQGPRTTTTEIKQLFLKKHPLI